MAIIVIMEKATMTTMATMTTTTTMATMATMVRMVTMVTTSTKMKNMMTTTGNGWKSAAVLLQSLVPLFYTGSCKRWESIPCQTHS